MVEVLLDRTDEMGFFVHPRNGDIYFELEDYVNDCITQLADPHPMPENGMSTMTAAAPVIEHLTDEDTPWERAWYVLEYLKNIYPAPSPSPSESPARDERDARRNFVADVVYGVQKWAIDHDDTALSANTAKLTCDLMERDLLFSGDDYGADPHAVNRMLAASLQNVVAKQASDSALYESVSGNGSMDVPRWFDAEDILCMRDCMSCALMGDKLNLTDMATVDFLLKTYGLDSEKLLDTWTYGFFNSSPEAPVNRIIKDNLYRIVTIEARRLGVSKRLLENRNIQCFARMSPEFLFYLDDAHDKPERAGIFNAVFDSSVVVGEAYNDPAMYDRLLQEVREAGHDLEYFEYASVGEWIKYDRVARENNIVHILQQEHADPIRGQVVQLGAHGRPGASYSVMDLKNSSTAAREHYTGIQSIAWNGCGVAKEGGLVDTLTEILRGVAVRGLTRASGVYVGYTARDGFIMRKDSERKPSPLFHDIGRSILPAFIAELWQPTVVEKIRYPDDVEAAMHYADMVARSVI